MTVHCSLKNPAFWLLISLLAALPASSASSDETVPLLEGLGDHHYAITTNNEKAQDYFDQGLRLYYAFNHAEAIRSFGEALDLAYAETMATLAALAATGDIDAAKQHQTQLSTIAGSSAIEPLQMEFNKSADILAVAEQVLAGRIAETEGEFDDAVAHMREAVRQEDALLYGEPP